MNRNRKRSAIGSAKWIAGLLWVWATFSAAGFEWITGPGYRSAELPLRTSGKAGFKQLLPAETRVLFTNVLTEERGITNQIYMNGSGVALGDVDGDGWVDIYLCGLDSPNKLFRNLGQWRFEDVTANAGVGLNDQASTGAVLADVDGDGDLDLLVNGVGTGTRLFLNDGKGHFREATAEAGLTSSSGSMSMALADIDGDGDLDLYVTNYRIDTFQDEPGVQFRVFRTNNEARITMVDGHPVTEAENRRYRIEPGSMSIRENGEADVLYRNDGRGHFSPVPWTEGAFLDENGQRIGVPYDWGLSVMFRDINGDGLPDIYVCNDADSPDRIWINRGGGQFQALPRLAVRETCFSSMGVDFADLNRDGFDEFFVVDMLARDHAGRHRQLVTRQGSPPPGLIETRPQYSRNMLYLNRGDGTYAEVAQMSGVQASDWSWMPLFLDVDLDGYEDLLISNGLERGLRDADSRRRIDAIKAQKRLSKREFQELRKMMARVENPNYAFRNRGDLTFEDSSALWGFNSRQISQGMALADLDNDGDLDIVVNCMNAAALVYRNDAPAPRVAVRLRGRAGNTRGVGAKIHVTGGPVPQSQEMISGGRYLSCDDAVRVFACGAATNGLAIQVTWRSGMHSVVRDAQPNRLYEVFEESATPPVVPEPPPVIPPLFRDASSLLQHRHVEKRFNDFAQQPLLSRRLSQLGPGVCWSDLNGDGREDLIIGSAIGGALGVFTNSGGTGFQKFDIPGIPASFDATITTVLNVPSTVGSRLLYGVSSYETGSTNDAGARQFEIRNGVAFPGPHLQNGKSSAGPMAAADVDGDGDLDLFVGGRVVPGRYPEAASSRLYRNVDAKLVWDESQQRLLDAVGLVSGAMFCDLDGDGFPELVLACEWGPLKIFRNDHGRFAAWDPPVVTNGQAAIALHQWTGWWNSVAAGDFDGDGRMDLVAGNWGRNTKYQVYLGNPLRIHYGDFNGVGRMEMVETYQEGALNKQVPWHHWDTLAQAMPFVEERFGGFTAYSEASVIEILGDRMKHARELTAVTLDSMVLLNRGDHFEARSLPWEAQLSPVFGLCVLDLDGDGSEDIFLAQNFFGIDSETSRYAAGLGLCLKGDGQGGFTAMTAQQSGIRIYGEQRGAAVADYDGDGRPDLAVAQNGAETKLFHNETATPGLRVRLLGPPGNSSGIGGVARQSQPKPVGTDWPTGNASGIGGVVRLQFAGKMGPAREIHAGSGYWSQDSAVLVLATPEPPEQVWVSWPGGAKTKTAIERGVREVTVDVSGKLIRSR